MMMIGKEAKGKSRIDGLVRISVILFVFYQVLLAIGGSNKKEDYEGLLSLGSEILDSYAGVGGGGGVEESTRATATRVRSPSNPMRLGLPSYPSSSLVVDESWNTNPAITVSYEKPTHKFHKGKFTLNRFVVNGVNLASYGFEEEHNERRYQPKQRINVVLSRKYQLFDSFNIADKIRGHETWKHMRGYHRDLQSPSMIFYMDKIAQKRFAKAAGYPTPKAFALKYKHELIKDVDGDDEAATTSSSAAGKSIRGTAAAAAASAATKNQTTATSIKAAENIVSKLLPPDADYVCKPSHDSTSSGVYLVQYTPKTGKQQLSYLGNIGTNPKMQYEYEPTELQTALAQQAVHDLQNRAADFESWALLHTQPGLVVEELYRSYDSDVLPAYEVKTLTIWGRVYMGYIKRGNGPYVALAYRDGTILPTTEEETTKDYWKVVPDWMQWDKVVELAEHLGRNKDLFRADIFVGLPSKSPKVEHRSSMRIALSETEFHPTSGFKEKGILQEASRLWMAGYKMNIFDVIENTEVPKAFLEKGYLSQEDADQLQFSTMDSWSVSEQ